jgi:CDP-glucose 4,6-dehydratase
MEDLEMNRSFWKNKSVFLTGHTGFKGGWIALWLYDMGAKVHGYALHPPTETNFFTEALVEKHLESSTIGDIRDALKIQTVMQELQPDIVIHMAAQPLVRHSYKNPVETYATNVMGSVNLFEAVRNTSSVKAVVNITTDKCYENKEWIWSYRENEPMGGHDPYSSSKACAELITSAYRNSFFKNTSTHLATVRAGNVIGGGDWAEDRLIPDFFRALDKNQTLTIRSPNAVRPWQHVLEPLAGYIKLAEKLYVVGSDYADAWNFGPNDVDNKTVQWIVEYLCAQKSDSGWQIDEQPQPHEANILKLDITKSKTLLGWHPQWDIATALEKIIEWHSAWKNCENMAEISLHQIHEYEQRTQV